MLQTILEIGAVSNSTPGRGITRSYTLLAVMLPTIFSLLLYVGAVRATAGFFKSDPNADSQCADLLWDPDRTHRARTTLENLFFMHIPKTAGTSFGGEEPPMPLKIFGPLPDNSGHLYDCCFFRPTVCYVECICEA